MEETKLRIKRVVHVDRTGQEHELRGEELKVWCNANNYNYEDVVRDIKESEATSNGTKN